ncbi:protein WEAK CHLOROPLAST MOVEMENT UNDER BLUE LIGHT 1-like [Hibiscus syriacus]|uniref:Protein WEAK CHLOROPLAST MOVEMENT UNDER BLUE LIGHT 1-like n=1 Tax=Hibiscus syriacus TaxID=106335 RepID=A0A6A3BK75_HIBSY|nr:protein WEAK CHLOROPLAST MOVEMENT UNDER BLUE LIGHT 1-like [Hibiscus syriacus]
MKLDMEKAYDRIHINGSLTKHLLHIEAFIKAIHCRHSCLCFVLKVYPPYFMRNKQLVVFWDFEHSTGFAIHHKDWGALELFHHFMFQESGLSKVPILNPKTLRWAQHNSLVRYHGMIQDMLGYEFYVGAYRDGGSLCRTKNFTDISQYTMESPSDTCIWELRLLYCIPVPRKSSWTEPSCDMDFNWSSQSREKRRRMDSEDKDPMDLVPDDEVKSSPITKKMRDELPSTSPEPMDLKTAGSSSTMNTFQFGDKDNLPCLVKIYDSPESDLKLNDVFKFIGVLTFDSELAVKNDANNELSNSFYDDALDHMPPNKVSSASSCLNCIVHKKLTVHDFLPGSPILEPQLVKEIREALFGYLTAILGNDGVYAHFMLLHILSKVHTRVDDVAVGKLSLNLIVDSWSSSVTSGLILDG